MTQPAAAQALPLPADWRDFFALTKPRVMSLVIFTGLCGLLAAPGHVDPVLGFTAILCIALGAGGAAALNQWWEADLDAGMRRTKSRPLPAGRMERTSARDFGVGLAAASVLIMGLAVGWLAGAILLVSIVYYAVVYTIWLKPRTPQNIVIGGGAGAFPPLIGWVAVTGHITVMPVVLFAIIFMWTPPHFWALALLRVRDYERAGVPMMPVVKGEDETRRQILIYSLILAPLGCVPAIVGLGGGLYTVAAGFLGAFFVMFAYACYSERVGPDAERAAKNLFAYSVLYLFLLFAVLLVEQGFGLGRSSIPLFWTS